MWINALGEQIHRHRDDVAIAGALAVAEQRAFHPLGTSQQRQFRSRNASAAIVVGMQADDDALAAGKVAREPFDLIGVDIRRCHLHRGR